MLQLNLATWLRASNQSVVRRSVFGQATYFLVGFLSKARPARVAQKVGVLSALETDLRKFLGRLRFVEKAKEDLRGEVTAR